MDLDWEKARNVIALYETRIKKIPDVVGISTGADRRSGTPRVCIRIYCAQAIDRGDLDEGKIPMELEGIPIELVISGPIRALDVKEDN